MQFPQLSEWRFHFHLRVIRPPKGNDCFAAAKSGNPRTASGLLETDNITECQLSKLKVMLEHGLFRQCSDCGQSAA